MNSTLFSKYYPQFLLIIIAFTFFTRMYRLHIPEKYVFDEVYHAVTAKLISRNDIRAYEWDNPPPEPNTAVDWLHPPYAKYTQALSMKVFGENSFGWRFSSVIFGCLVVLLTAKIAEELFDNKPLALIAAFLVSLDGLVLVMSRIAMNDIHVTTFILLSFWLYLKFFNSKRKTFKYLFFSGIAAGFATGTKWSGAFTVGIISLFETIQITKNFLKTKNKFSKKSIKQTLKQISITIVAFIFIPITLYILSYSHMFLLGKDFNHLIEMHKNTWWYQTHLTATHPAQSTPLQWFLNTKPVWVAVDYSTKNMRADIYAVGNPLLFWIGDLAIFGSIFILIFEKLQKKTEKINLSSKNSKMLTMLLVTYFVLWLPWQLSPRIMFFYHYLPAVPLLSINLAYWIDKIWKSKNKLNLKIGKQKIQLKFSILAPIIIFIIFVNFIVWYPHLTAIPVPLEWKDKLYFFFDFWKQS